MTDQNDDYGGVRGGIQQQTELPEAGNITCSRGRTAPSPFHEVGP